LIEDIKKYYKLLIKPTDGVVSRYINRRISIPLTVLIVKSNLPLTPNQVSLLSFLLGIVAALFYILKNPILAGILVQVSSIIDGVDGELARILGKQSKLGAYLDAVLDRITNIAIMASIAYYLAITNNINELTITILLLALSGDLMVSYIHARGEASLQQHPSKIGKIPNFASRDVRLFIIFVGSIIGLLIEALITIAVISYTYVILKSIEIYINLQK